MLIGFARFAGKRAEGAMRIYSSPDAVVDEQKPGSLVVNSKHWERSRICEVPLALALLPHGGLADSITAAQIFSQAETAKLFRSDGSAMGAGEVSIIRSNGTYLT